MNCYEADSYGYNVALYETSFTFDKSNLSSQLYDKILFTMNDEIYRKIEFNTIK